MASHLLVCRDRMRRRRLVLVEDFGARAEVALRGALSEGVRVLLRKLGRVSAGHRRRLLRE